MIKELVYKIFSEMYDLSFDTMYQVASEAPDIDPTSLREQEEMFNGDCNTYKFHQQEEPEEDKEQHEADLRALEEHERNQLRQTPDEVQATRARAQLEEDIRNNRAALQDRWLTSAMDELREIRAQQRELREREEQIRQQQQAQNQNQGQAQDQGQGQGGQGGGQPNTTPITSLTQRDSNQPMSAEEMQRYRDRYDRRMMRPN